MERLARKHDYARTLVPKPVVDEVEGAEIGIIAYGSTDSRRAEAREHAGEPRRQDELPAPARAADRPMSSREFVAKYPRIYVVENNSMGRWRRFS